jgi:ring-1,2-phenylacetyl-CoA epoxidase subunit PaaE
MFHSLTVGRVDRLCEDAVAITFEVPDELRPVYDFEAGQFLTLRREVDGRDERRSYSVCAERGALPRVGVREVPGGLFSEWLVHQVAVGDTIQVHTPQGSFVADPAAGGNHLMVAVGSGITPMLSLARTLLSQSPPDDPARVTLLYGNRRTTSVMFAEELADLKDRHLERLDLVHVLSREPRDVDLFSGRLDGDRLRTLLTTVAPLAPDTQVWLCGPFAMLTEARAVLTDLGVSPDRIHVELFYVEDIAPPTAVHQELAPDGPTCEVTVVLDGKATTAALPTDIALLDAAQRVRADLPFACKGGVCGTCRARVVEGKVDMRRNYALEPAEVEAGFVLTCQSFPVSDRVRIDYDA